MAHWAMRDTPPGWFNHADALLAIVEALKPARMLEVGSYLGQSGIALGRVLATWDGTLTCVDVWTQTPAGPADTFPTFATNVAAAGLTNITPWRACSLEAAARYDGPPFDAIYIDADHTYEAVRADLRAWWPHLADGGLLAGDDYHHPGFPGVARAWNEFGRDVHPVITPPLGVPGLVWGIKGAPLALVGSLAPGVAPRPVTLRQCADCRRMIWSSDGDAAGRCVDCQAP